MARLHCWVLLAAAVLAACTGSPSGAGPGQRVTLATPEPVTDPANGEPNFAGQEHDAFGMQTAVTDADDDPDGLWPLNEVSNPLNVFGAAALPFFLVRDVDNPANPNQNAGPEATATWTLAVTGYTDLKLAVDLAAKGDFETDDVFALNYQFDNGPAQPLFDMRVDETGVQTYTLSAQSAGPVLTDTLFDPLVVTDAKGPRALSNRFHTFQAVLTGTGNTLTVRLEVIQDGGSEMLALKNLVVTGVKTK